jgi:serine/threonine protein kinase
VEHLITKRIEAMKILNSELATETQVKRFEREMRVLARLHHPNIAALHNVVHMVDGTLILFMEYIEGPTLENLFAAGGIPNEAGIGYIRQILHALQYAHQQGVVHRDITPANVIVTAAGEVKLMDFGLSKSFGDSLLSTCGEILGSLPYMAPEQLKGATHPDPRSDLYSTGVILYEHLTGRKAFGAHRRLAPVVTDSEAPPQPPSQLQSNVTVGWDEIVLRAIARDPVHRYQSAEEFESVLAQFEETREDSFQVPNLRATGVGILTLVGVLLAFAVLPAFRMVTASIPSPPAMRKLYIAAPAFALAKTAEPQPFVLPSHPPEAIAAHIHRTIAPPAEPKLFEPVAPEEPKRFEPLAEPKLLEFVAAPEPKRLEPEAAAEPKRRFWNKLNIFKKRKASEAKKEQQATLQKMR